MTPKIDNKPFDPERNSAEQSHRKGSRCTTRRDFVRVGGLAALGIGLGDLFRFQRIGAAAKTVEVSNSSQIAASKGKAKSCILIWLDGGPSHLETFDPKPDAPAEVRGPIGSISTSVPGIRISECLPKTAAILDKLAIVRSLTSPLGEHNFGTHYMMTGYKPTPVLEYPTFGAVLSHSRIGAGDLPANIAVPNFHVGGSKLNGGGFLPKAVHPFSVGGDPSKPNFQVKDLDLYKGLDLTRLDRRRQFVNALDEFGRQADGGSKYQIDSDLDRAYRLITSAEAKAAFELNAEPQKVRDSYGSRTIGQSCLLARRLVERGVSFVTVNNPGWDTHTNLYTRLKEGYSGARVPVGLIPSLDFALSGLIRDLDDRGMLDETLVVVMGEFGRTPKLNTDAGRDHWPRVFSAVLAGGGVSGAQVIGSSDAIGESPRDRPVTPSDLAATIYTLLGIDLKHELQTRDGRPVTIVPAESNVIQELVS